MIYPHTIEQKLGFDKLRNRLEELCSSELGREWVGNMRFSNNFRLVERLTRQTAEMVEILKYEVSFPVQTYVDLRSPLRHLKIEGAFLTEEELFDFKKTFGSLLEVLRFFDKTAPDQYTELKSLFEQLHLDDYVIRRIERILNEQGKLQDHASPQLAEIRKELLNLRQKLRKEAERVFQRAQSLGYTPDDSQPTLRNGRIVIPVRVENKRQLKGFIQDESNTGQTVYIEPAELVEINNDIRELELEEKREIIRILSEVSAQIREQLPAFLQGLEVIAKLDFVMAKAKLAIEMGATAPNFVDRPQLDWQEAVHPLLWYAHRENNKPVVPLSIRLDEAQRIMVISGPNAGGKSIALQTVGLLQYMWQCGLLIPLGEHSTVGFFEDIFIDIGDEQSIENDLSTYSSHLSNMRFFLQHARERTLFLIDEFGAGTEPQLGGAIAEAILEALYERGAYGVLNTHYGNLKRLADRMPGMVNAAMRFDLDKLEPLYQLVVGQAGSSYAFEIARKIGLPKSVLQRAKEKLGDDAFTYDKLLKELAEERKRYEQLYRQTEEEMRRLKQQQQAYEKKMAELQEKRNEFIRQAKKEAKQLLEGVNRKIEQAVREIREHQAEQNRTKQIRQEIEQLKENFKEVEELPTNTTEDYEVIGGEIQVGDWVRLKDAPETIGEVVEITGKDARILIGQLTSEVKLNRLERISRRQAKQQMKHTKGGVRYEEALHEKFKNFSHQIDLRGMRGEEAIQQLSRWLDEAILVGAKELRIVHGKGDGILRKLVREELRRYPQVLSFGDEHIERGGDGVTIVKMA
ncbi:DNA mismatch repair protein MutS2 [Thermonema lapsum]|uniref:Endonuclease MutS2 n=1 Tax=Thermonema lapsum TaxID=28195 RepID=A0A846MQP5_9BACT|nr:endonuclease MutS2 [Thermonema lapsum]NIK73751.1 DNA mismatch repair protein MutS2 [Thermonema lapsum]